MLTLKNLAISFESNDDTIHAVNNTSLTIEPGQFVGLVGESGSGKSVTALSILDLLPTNATIGGDILWKGTQLNTADRTHLQHTRGKDIGMIFQNPMLAFNPVLTIGNHFIETIQLHQSVTKHEAELLAIDYLDKVHITQPKKRLSQYPHEFSLGMCQRAMIALTLSMQPSLLIADEPTASLDVTVQAEIMKLLDEINHDMNMAILFISHDLGVIAQHCDYVYIMYLGDILEQGQTAEIFKQPSHDYTKTLLSSIPNPDPTTRKTPFKTHTTSKTKPLLTLTDLSVQFNVKTDPFTAVSGSSLSINAGDFVGLAGESGSGKSVTALSILDLLPSTATIGGDIFWNGQSITGLNHHELQRIRGNQIGMIFQNPLMAFNPVLTIGAHFIETLQLHQQLTNHAAEKKALEFLNKVHITHPEKRLHQYPHEFSLGMCQRAMIALTLCMEPALLIADEPTASLDVTVQAQIMDLLTEINQELNTAILFISHDLGVIAQHCDYVYIMYLSNIVEHGDTVRIFTDPQHSYTKRLLSAIPKPIPR
tara:strand:+ start:832 stop:2442 length:1611 start_codon:yes stop_codon:yes gene_type:complete